MKKYKYVVAVACLLLGAMGFAGLYMTNQTENEQAKNQDSNQDIVEESDEIIIGSNLSDYEDFESDEENQEENQFAEIDIDSEDTPDSNLDQNMDQDDEIEDLVEPEQSVGTITQEKLHFNPDNGVVWPIEGTVLLDYSMDKTIFFPTLQQYQYNPAMVISGKVNDKVYFVAKGKITDIKTNEETGCTVTQDIGDGYTAIYGQLKELNFEVGDMVESGQVVGYVGEPTKYYSLEGSNVYFQVLKDGVPVDPEEILP